MGLKSVKCTVIFAMLLPMASAAVTEAEQTVDFSAAVSQSAKIGLRMTMTILPIIGLFVAVLWFRRRYKLNEAKMAEINAELEASKGEKA